MPDGPPVSVSELPTHTGPLFVAVGVGNAFTVTVTLRQAALTHPVELFRARA